MNKTFKFHENLTLSILQQKSINPLTLKNLHFLRIYGTYIVNQKFDFIRISVLDDITKIWKNHNQYIKHVK